MELARATENDLHLIQEILEAAPNYEKNISGGVVGEKAAEELMKARPLGINQNDKHVLLIKDENYKGVIDLVFGYPNRHTVFLGLLLLREDIQGNSLGKKSYQLIEDYISHFDQKDKIRLAVVESNPVIGFWEKMGFKTTGEVKPYENGELKSRAILMEKKLR